LRDDSIWKEFKIIVTDPPHYRGHFELIKHELIPFVDKSCLPFWITNYFDHKQDYILFRVEGDRNQLKYVENFLNDLVTKGLIVRWIRSSWDPRDDARARIDGLKSKIPNFDPNTTRIEGVEFANGGQRIRVFTTPDSNIEERKEQLTALFEALGECTKAVYRHLETKPEDKWIMSVFIHLFLNSLDYSGPNLNTDEDRIRRIPVW
jgi:hypothetical protein